MTAPALVLLAEGSAEPRVVEVIHQLRKQMQVQRPELSIHLAFLDHCPPSGPQVVSTLAARGVKEIVFAPLTLSHAVDVGDAAEQMLATVRRNHPGLSVTVAHPIGPATELLNVLDLRLRNALSACHALELDALVLCAPDCGDPRGASLLARRARQWGSHHKLPVAVACADGSGTSVVSAMASLHEQGRRAIAVGCLFLTADDSYVLASEQAIAAGAVAVSAPLGADGHIIDLIIARYAFAAMAMLDNAPASEHLGADVLTTGNTQLMAL
ncbi:Sirohydrochlorin ferrochelatase [Propionibacterium cyclohexanicum]|uniref:Sirohydrochlorin ferrochelatase n=2 Tax=Propionibacterium cyclohexanicum TaxID=64702 RepID=A0A1H9QNB3_9ACTN|nr:Sirohydrochlorin ferrochelatase [Propionibacterium cyclohexanicum]